MSKKICVYAICKNESKFIDRWVDSLQGEADCVVVLDTGSTDDSVEKLQKYSPFVTVKQFDYFKELGYFRFDKARNDSLKLVPFDIDICVILDLDHVPVKGWGDLIRSHFENGYQEVYGPIVDHHPETGVELNSWSSKNVHPNSPYWVWDKIIHEGIHYKGDDKIKSIYDENFIINHYPTESKDRSLYRTLLEYACKEHPKDPYYGIYLGIELSRRYSNEEAEEAFRRCLKECDFKYDEEIHCQCYINLVNMIDNKAERLALIEQAKVLAIKKSIPTRRLFNLLATVYEEAGLIDKAINALKYCIDHIQSYSSDWKDDENLFKGYIEDRLSLFYYYHKNDPYTAMKYEAEALKLSPDNTRMINNMKFYVDSINKTNRNYDNNQTKEYSDNGE